MSKLKTFGDTSSFLVIFKSHFSYSPTRENFTTSNLTANLFENIIINNSYLVKNWSRYRLYQGSLCELHVHTLVCSDSPGLERWQVS